MEWFVTVLHGPCFSDGLAFDGKEPLAGLRAARSVGRCIIVGSYDPFASVPHESPSNIVLYVDGGHLLDLPVLSSINLLEQYFGAVKEPVCEI